MIDTTVPLPCRAQPDLFTAPEGENRQSAAYKQRARKAKQLCWDCPEWQPCRDQARATKARGVWGGEDDTDRARLGVQPRRRTPRALPDACGTVPGVSRHRRRGERPCEPCLQAERIYQAGIRKKRRATELTATG